MAAITVKQFNDIIRHDLPWAHDIGMHADAISDGTAILRLPFAESMLRPGGVISGPTIMALADACMYAVVLSRIGEVKLAVTTSFNINFLHRADPADLLAEGNILKLGKRLAWSRFRCTRKGRPAASLMPPGLTLFRRSETGGAADADFQDGACRGRRRRRHR